MCAWFLARCCAIRPRGLATLDAALGWQSHPQYIRRAKQGASSAPQGRGACTACTGAEGAVYSPMVHFAHTIG